MASTGTTTTGTSGAGWTSLPNLASLAAPSRIVIRNNGTVDGWFQLVGVTTGIVYMGPRYLAAGDVWEVPGPMGSANEKHILQIQRVGGVDMTGVSADVS